MGKLVYLGLVEVHTVKIIFLTYVGRVFENLRKRKYKILNDLRTFSLSGFLFWAMEPIQKDGNDGKLRQVDFSGKKMNGALFSWIKTDPFYAKFPKSLIWTDIFLAGNSKSQVV